MVSNDRYFVIDFRFLGKINNFPIFEQILIDLLEICFLNFDDVCPKTSIKSLNVQTFQDFEADVQSMFKYLSFGTNPRFLAQLVKK